MLEYDSIMLHIEKTYSIKKGTLNKHNKSRTMAEARAVAQFLMRDCCGLSYPEIGNLFNRAHISVMSSCDKIERMLVEDNNRVCYAVYTYLNNRDKLTYTKCELNNPKAKKKSVAKNAIIADKSVRKAVHTSTIKPSSITVDKCIATIEKIYMFKAGTLLQKSNSNEFITEARKISTYLLSKHCGKTLVEVADMLGFKCHSSCSTSSREVALKIEQGDNDIVYVINKFNKMIGIHNAN